jgi:hypothetical protein
MASLSDIEKHYNKLMQAKENGSMEWQSLVTISLIIQDYYSLFFIQVVINKHLQSLREKCQENEAKQLVNGILLSWGERTKRKLGDAMAAFNQCCGDMVHEYFFIIPQTDELSTLFFYFS